MASDKIIISDREAADQDRGLTYNLDSTCPIVEIQDGFNLYRALYENSATHDQWGFVYGSESDTQAIETAFNHEPKNMRCIFVNRLILRKDGEPSSTIIWGD